MKKKISAMSIFSLLVSILSFVSYCAIFETTGTTKSLFRFLWIALSIPSIILPIVSKWERSKSHTFGKTAEVIALIIGLFTFHIFLFYLTNINGTICLVITIALLVLYAKSFNATPSVDDVHVCNNTPPKETPKKTDPFSPVASAPPTAQLPTKTDMPKRSPTVSEIPVRSKQRYCKMCGGAIDQSEKKCTKCGKQYFKIRKNAVYATTAITIIVSLLALNIYQHWLYCKETDRLNNTISSMSSTISDQTDDIISQGREISDLRIKANYYDDIYQFLTSGNIGYASDSFNSDKSIFIVDKNERGEKITLTALLSSSETISISQSSYCATVSFDEDVWPIKTTLTINPLLTGATVLTFYDSIRSESFQILIIVTD